MKGITALILCFLFLFSCKTGNKDINNEIFTGVAKKVINLVNVNNIKIDNAGCIHIEPINACSPRLICPADSIMYWNARLMMYVDSNLAEGEPAALLFSCCILAHTLAKDSIEIYLFNGWWGGSYQEMHIYHREKDGKFKLLKFNPENEAREFRVLETSTNGARDFQVKKVYSSIHYIFKYNGKEYDTAYINDLPYREFLKSGIDPDFLDSTLMIADASLKFIRAGTSTLQNTGYHPEKCCIFAGFEKNYSGEYEFIGYFPSIPQPEYRENSP